MPKLALSPLSHTVSLKIRTIDRAIRSCLWRGRRFSHVCSTIQIEASASRSRKKSFFLIWIKEMARSSCHSSPLQTIIITIIVSMTL